MSLIRRRMARNRAQRMVGGHEPAPAMHDQSDGGDGEGYVSRLVIGQDTIPEEARMGGDYMHLSSLAEACPRAHVLSHLPHASVAPESVSAGMRLVWVIGRAVEAHIRKQFIAARRFQGVVGKWSCLCGEKTQIGLREDDKPCRFCKHSTNVYGELTMFDQDSGVAGNPDLLYLRSNGKLRVVEIKSIKKDGFDGLVKPVPDHRLQALGYRRLAELNGFEVDDAVTVIYAAKDFVWAPYKEFEVKETEGDAEILDMMFGTARTVHAGKKRMEQEGLTRLDQLIQNGVLPARKSVCSSAESTVAKNCALCSLCFSVAES